MNPLAKRIDLNKFIRTLVNLYNTGADYIDLEYITEEQQDPFVRIHVKEDYMSTLSQPRKEELYEINKEEEEAPNEEEEENGPLSDEDINDLTT